MSLTAGPAAGSRTPTVPAAGSAAAGGRLGQLVAEGVAVWLD